MKLKIRLTIVLIGVLSLLCLHSFALTQISVEWCDEWSMDQSFIDTDTIPVDSVVTEEEVDLSTVFDIPTQVFIPSAFTPNGDFLNDEFQVICSGDYTYFECVIYSVWGKELYRFDDANETWDGTLEGDVLPTGTYAYRVLVDGKEYMGKLQLIR